VTGTYQRYYLVENREYAGWDTTLRDGPYQFSKPYSAPNWVEFFKFQNGLLVWYVDESVEDNNTSVHPGSGSSLPVDARPAAFGYEDGVGAPSNRRQPFDATFGLEATDNTCLHKEVLVGKKNPTIQTVAACKASSPGIPVFDDTNPEAYWSSTNPQNSVKVNGHGVKVTVTSDAGSDLVINVVNPAAPTTP
jgi:immune inhibitor A